MDYSPIPNQLRDPANGHHAPFGIGKLLMIALQMLFIPRVLLHSLIIVHAVEHDLAEAVKVCELRHLVVKKPCHKAARLGSVVDLWLLSENENDSRLRESWCFMTTKDEMTWG